MSLLWIEGFDSWANTTLNKSQYFNYMKGGTRLLAANVGLDIIDTGQRNGTGKFVRFHWDHTTTFVNAFMDNPTANRTIINTSRTWTLGVAVRVSALPTSGNLPLIYLNCNGSNSLFLLLTPSGTLRLSKSTTLLTDASNTSSVAVNTWYYIEIKAKNAAGGNIAAGDIQVRVNGTQVVSVAGSQTLGGAGGNWTDFGLLDPSNQTFSQGGSGTVDFDDLYLIDDQGTHNNSFLGDCRVETLFPNGAGASAQWTPNTAVANYLKVNEIAQDGDTTYVSTAGVGNRDSYTLDDLSSVPLTIFGVQACALARRDAGETTRTMNVSIRSGGSYSDGATSLPLNSVYTVTNTTSNATGIKALFETDPGGSAWTGTSVNAMEAGIKLDA